MSNILHKFSVQFLTKCNRVIGLAGHNYRCMPVTTVTDVSQYREMSSKTKTKSNTKNKLDISGVFPPIVTPFDWEENIYWDKLETNLRLWNKCHFKGYVVQGSNGEYAYLNPEERVEMVSRMRRMTTDDKLIIAGSGCEATRDTIEMTSRMADAGADAVLVVTPSYYKGQMSDAALEQHYIKVADSSPVPVVLYNVSANTNIDMNSALIIDLAKHPNIIGLKDSNGDVADHCPAPVVLYNVTPYTGIDMSVELATKLAEHPNIIGLYDSNGDVAKLADLVYKTKDYDFQILAGSASFLYPALLVGCVGGVCALANVLGDAVCKLSQLHHAGKHEEAQLLQQRLVAPNIGVTRKYGVPGLKTAMDWFGYYGGPTRSPLQPLTEAQVKDVRDAFTKSNFLK